MDKEILINKIAERSWKSATDDPKIYMAAVKEVIEQTLEGYTIVKKADCERANLSDINLNDTKY